MRHVDVFENIYAVTSVTYYKIRKRREREGEDKVEILRKPLSSILCFLISSECIFFLSHQDLGVNQSPFSGNFGNCLLREVLKL